MLMLIFHYFSQYLALLLPLRVLSLQKKEFIVVSFSKIIKKTLHLLKEHTNSQFQYISDICGVDYIQNKKRFEVVYNLLSLRYNQRIRIRTLIGELDSIESIVSLFVSANWWEREAWDMFGIHFEGNKKLFRILTDYGFKGYPLRKDFPLSGFFEVRFNDLLMRVQGEPVEFMQNIKIN